MNQEFCYYIRKHATFLAKQFTTEQEYEEFFEYCKCPNKLLTDKNKSQVAALILLFIQTQIAGNEEKQQQPN